MSTSIENTLKHVGFTEGQVKVLTPIFEKTLPQPTDEKDLAYQVAEVKGRLSMLTWGIGILVIVLIGVNQKIFSDISDLRVGLTDTQKQIQDLNTSTQKQIQDLNTNTQKQIQDLKVDVHDLKRDSQDLKRDMQDIKVLLEKIASNIP